MRRNTDVTAVFAPGKQQPLGTTRLGALGSLLGLLLRLLLFPGTRSSTEKTFEKLLLHRVRGRLSLQRRSRSRSRSCSCSRSRHSHSHTHSESHNQSHSPSPAQPVAA